MMYKFTEISFILWLKILIVHHQTRAICPQECICISDEQRLARCDNAALSDIPALLDPRITSLSMFNCTLKRLDPDVLELYPDLEYLDLSFNNIDMLDLNIFKYQTKLRVLRLSVNRLPWLHPESFVGLNQLQLLDLSMNQLYKIDPLSFIELDALQELRLSNNLLKVLPPNIFAGLKKLKRLDLSGNQLHTIAHHMFDDIPSLDSLNLSNNNITVISPDAFNGLSTLKHLDISSNSLADPSFNGLNNLVYINMSNNLVQRITASQYRSLGSLRELDLSFNQMIELSTSSFDGLQSLEILTMTNEPYLHTIRLNAFSGLVNLRKLNLSSCSALEKIDENAFELDDRLEVLDLSNCHLERLPSKLVKWTKLKSLNIYGNPLHCDCELLSFLPEVLRALSLNAFCFTPPWLFNKNISQLSESCSTMNESQLSMVIVGVSLFALTIFILLGVFIRRHLKPCNKFFHSKYRTPSKYRTQLYSRPFLITSPINDKSDVLSEQTCYTTTNRSASNGFSRSGGLYDEEGYYSSVILPTEYNAYERARPLYPTPPPAMTIPQTLPASCVDDNFRIISEYPVPITEL